ncbi:MAG: hypothetical protein P8046_07255 [Anaerolineales bacterium]
MMNSKRILFRDVPVFLWLIGLVFFGLGLYTLFDGSAPTLVAIGVILGSGLILALIPIVTVSVDASSGVLVVRNTGILNRKHRELPVHKVAEVHVERHVSSDTDGTSITYRVVIMMEDGEEIPLRKGYSSGFRKKESQAEAIRTALGVGGTDQDKAWTGDGATDHQLGLRSVDSQEKIDIASGEHETNGVRWELETYAWGGVNGGTPVYRWLSTDFETPGYFLFLVQKADGQGQQKGLMNLAGKVLIKQSLRLYGFDPSYTPGMNTATSLDDADRRLVEQFFIYTSSPVEACRLLNPWTVMPLIGWTERYALETRSKKFHQLSVLYSPNGVYVSVLNMLDASQADELVSLGVELLRAQGV